jgi:hypothetical protein
VRLVFLPGFKRLKPGSSLLRGSSNRLREPSTVDEPAAAPPPAQGSSLKGVSARRVRLRRALGLLAYVRAISTCSSILHSRKITNMANKFGIPQEVEDRLRRKFKVCAYCRREMREYAGVKGCPSDKATIEHLNWKGPFYWSGGLKEEDLVLCCGACNSSRGTKLLAVWFTSLYCREKGISAATVADEVKKYLQTASARD